jgi:adenylate kinase family enzyme
LTKQQIGAKLQLALLEGQKLDDTLLVSLVIDAMGQEPEKAGGIILVDFPRTKQQAQLFERELSGFEDPKPLKKGDLKRTKDRERSTTARNRSMILATENTDDGSNASPSSGLDAVFLLDVPTEVAISRAAGQLADSITGEKYHIEFHPPPSNSPGVFDRLVPVEDPSKETAQLQYQLAAFEEEEGPLKEWIDHFKILHVFPF